MTNHFVSSGGVRLHVKDFGGQGRPLIMLHSTGFGQWMWQPIATALAGRFRVLAPDQRGHGDSEKPDSGYDFPTLARDLEAVCEAFGVEDVAAMGHSSGGTTIVEHAALFPGRLRSLLLIEPILPTGPRWQPGDDSPQPSSMAERARKRKPGFASADGMFDSFHSRPPFDTWQPDILRLYCNEGTVPVEAGVALKCPPELEARFYDAVAHFDARPSLAAANLPMRVLWGESGVRSRRRSDVIELPAGSQSEVVVGTTHFIPMEKPDVIAQAVLDFFGEDSN